MDVSEMEKAEKKINYKEYYKDVAKIRHTIASMMKKHGLVTSAPVSDDLDGLNGLFSQICSNGAFGITILLDTPSKILTPLGEIRIHIVGPVDHTGQSAFMKEFNETFGIEPIVAKYPKHSIESFYSITKLPWKPDKKFPTFQAKQDSYFFSPREFIKGFPRGKEAVVPDEIAERAYKSIMKEVNRELKASGEGRYVIEDSKSK